jgi:hypothetical protein
MEELRLEEAAADVPNDCAVNGPTTHDHRWRWIELHPVVVFGGRRMTNITTDEIGRFTAGRLEAGAAPAAINCDLAIG